MLNPIEFEDLCQEHFRTTGDIINPYYLAIAGLVWEKASMVMQEKAALASFNESWDPKHRTDGKASDPREVGTAISDRIRAIT